MGLLDAAATMTAYDSIERGVVDECEPLRGRRPRTFTLTQLLVACGAVCVCTLAATTVVNTHRGLANFDYDSALGGPATPMKQARSQLSRLESQIEQLDQAASQIRAIVLAKSAEMKNYPISRLTA